MLLIHRVPSRRVDSIIWPGNAIRGRTVRYPMVGIAYYSLDGRDTYAAGAPLRQRLALLYGDDESSLTVSRGPQGQFQVEIMLPLELP